MLATLEATQEKTELAYWEGIHDDIIIGDHHYIPTIEEKVVSLHASLEYNKKGKQVLQTEPVLIEEPPMQAS